MVKRAAGQGHGDHRRAKDGLVYPRSTRRPHRWQPARLRAPLNCCTGSFIRPATTTVTTEHQQDRRQVVLEPGYWLLPGADSTDNVWKSWLRGGRSSGQIERWSDNARTSLAYCACKTFSETPGYIALAS